MVLFLTILSCCLFLCLVLTVLLLIRSRSARPQDSGNPALPWRHGDIFENSVEAILIADEHLQVISANPAAERLLGIGELTGKHFPDLFTTEGRKALLDQLAGADEPVFLRSLTLPNGKAVSCSFGRSTSQQSDRPTYIFYLHEITEIKELLVKLDQLAYYDALTGLYNRPRFNQKLDEWVERYKQSQQDFILFFMDLTNFKYINDTFGHDAGDQALCAVADALRGVIAPGDVLGRFSGDEFVILHPAGDWEPMVARIHKALNSIDCGDFAPGFQIDAGIGHCLYSEAGGVTDLFKTADLRMYNDKTVSREAKGVAALRRTFSDYAAASNVLGNDLFTAFAGASSRVYIYICDMRTDMSRWSANAVEYFGMPGEYMEAAGDIWIKHIHPDDQAIYEATMEGIMSGSSLVHKAEYRARNAQGDYVWLEARGRTVVDQDGHPKIFAGMMTRLDARNRYDPLTHLKTLAEFNQYDFSQENGTVLLLGMDKFRSVINTYGYSFGDTILQQFAKRVTDAFGADHDIYRMGGDEFLVVSPGADRAQTQQLYHELRGLATDLGDEDQTITVGFSAGGVVYPDDGTTRETLLQNLEHSMEHAKRRNPGTLVFFSQYIAEQHTDRMARRSLILQSIQNNFDNFTLYYQPLVSTDDHRILGCEALLRWVDPKGSVIRTDDLIRQLESDRGINIVGEWVADQAMAQAKRWQDRFGPLLMGFNTSYLQFRNRQFVPTLIRMAEKHQVDPRFITIELTESCAVEQIAELADNFQALRDVGFRIAMDDFGIGYSTLLTLRELPIDSVKIDHAFVRSLTPENTTDLAIVNSVTSLAHQLGLSIVLEGVENETVLHLVKPLDANYYQGYHFARPMPAEKFEKLLEENQG